MKNAIIITVSAIATAPAFAGNSVDRIVVAVPEITSLEGTAAVALIAAVIALIWERRKT